MRHFCNFQTICLGSIDCLFEIEFCFSCYNILKIQRNLVNLKGEKKISIRFLTQKNFQFFQKYQITLQLLQFLSLSLRIYSCIFDMNFLKIHFHFPGHLDPHVLLLGIFTLQFLSIAFFQIFTWIIFSVVSTSAISVASRLTTRKIRFPLASRLSRFFTSKSSPWKCENLNFWRQKSWIFLSFQNQFKIKTFEFSR